MKKAKVEKMFRWKHVVKTVTHDIRYSSAYFNTDSVRNSARARRKDAEKGFVDILLPHC